MAQNYKVYHAGRPVIFAQTGDSGNTGMAGAFTFVSQGKVDTMLIENAIKSGNKSICVQCKDVEASWQSFREQFEFVQAAGGLVINGEKKILFIFRNDKWDLPKGKVESGESIVDGAAREVEEECSISDLNVVNLLTESWHTYNQKGDQMIKSTVWYLMEYKGSKVPAPQIQEGITEVVWLGESDLEMIYKNTYPSVIDVLETYLNQKESK
jgi:ADP-ribose pyrophosphatase YjhB (NUDIX family)